MLSGYVARPFRLLAAFRGRSSRREFLCFTIMMWTSMFAAIGFGGAFNREGSHNWTVGLFLVVMLAFITPALAVKDGGCMTSMHRDGGFSRPPCPTSAFS